jgi:hypothetical protein
LVVNEGEGQTTTVNWKLELWKLWVRNHKTKRVQIDQCFNRPTVRQLCWSQGEDVDEGQRAALPSLILETGATAGAPIDHSV